MNLFAEFSCNFLRFFQSFAILHDWLLTCVYSLRKYYWCTQSAKWFLLHYIEVNFSNMWSPWVIVLTSFQLQMMSLLIFFIDFFVLVLYICLWLLFYFAPHRDRNERGSKLIAITLQGAIEKTSILLSHYWKNGQLERTIIFRGININFAHCIWNRDWGNNSFYKGVKFIKNLREI